jgi:hypothetical protein
VFDADDAGHPDAVGRLATPRIVNLVSSAHAITLDS